MKILIKKAVCLFFAIALLMGVSYHCDAKATDNNSDSINCKSLCGEALKATGGSSNLKYQSVSAMDFGGLSFSARKKVKQIQYVCDDKEAYSLCVIEANNTSGSKAILKQLKKYKKNNSKSDYLSDYSADEQKVFKNAVCGRKGNVVWYIAMSTSKKNNQKGQKAIKKKL